MNGPARKLGLKPHDRILARLHNFTLRVRQGEFDDNEDLYRPGLTEADDLGYKPIWLGFNKTRKNVYVELTGMTVEELDEFKRCINLAIEGARPLCAELDRQAQESLDADNDVIPYRALKMSPVVVVRPIQALMKHTVDQASVVLDNDLVESIPHS